MKNYLYSVLLVAASASFAVHAFAGGYGPAPFYRPSVGAPASQRGQSVQTVVAELNQENAQPNAGNAPLLNQQTPSGHATVAKHRVAY